jgi:hypothetical protein
METTRMFQLDDDVNATDVQCLIGLHLLVECSSWGETDAPVLFGSDWATKKIGALITKVTGTKVKKLKFQLEVADLEQVYTGYSWTYVLKYITDSLPLSFSQIPTLIQSSKAPKRKDDTKKKENSDNTTKKQCTDFLQKTAAACERITNEEVKNQLSLAVLDVIREEIDEALNTELFSQIENAPAPLDIVQHTPTFESSLPDNPTTPQISTVPPVLQPIETGPIDADYMKRHCWMKCWGKHARLHGTGAAERQSMPIAPLDLADFKHPRFCYVYTEWKKKFNQSCPAMLLHNINPSTQLICSYCKVYLHAECHTVYHQMYASDKLVLP